MSLTSSLMLARNHARMQMRQRSVSSLSGTSRLLDHQQHQHHELPSTTTFGMISERGVYSSLQLLRFPGNQQQQQQRRWMSKKRSVRIILKEDLPNGKAYKGDVIRVKPGFARNHLIPGKFALYATEENFAKLDMQDPELETPEQKAERLAKEKENALDEEGQANLKAADILKYYLRNKVVTLYRKVDPETQRLDPGMVDRKAVRTKLSKQLKIDLQRGEWVHIREEPIENPDDVTPDSLLEIVEGMDDTVSTGPCSIELKQLGYYVARITLAGGYAVPLQFQIVRSE